MSKLKLPPTEYLRQRFEYDAKNGNLYFRAIKGRDAWNKRNAGRLASQRPNSRGYLLVSIDGVSYRQHRIIWKYLHDEEPDFIDHIDRNPLNNRPKNLRSVSRSINQRNRSKPSTNTSGHVGVYWLKGQKKWMAQAADPQGIPRTIGYFENKYDAVSAREQAAANWGYHPSHGS